MTKWQLFAAFIAGEPVKLVRSNSMSGVACEGTIASIEREDGSGSSWNVTLQDGRGKHTVYVRTVD